MREFRDRRDGGRALAAMLTHYANRPDVIVLGLPRGGLPVADEVARALNAPLDVLVVRKLGLPGHEELAMGAIASGGVRVLNEDVVQALRIPSYVIEEASEREKREMERREQLYRADRPFPDLRGKTVIVVDDGLATGSTMRAAVGALKKTGPQRIVVAVPTAASSTYREFQAEVDECICVSIPEWFLAVGQSYLEFPQTSDDEVRKILDGAAREKPGAERGPGARPYRVTSRRRGSQR